MLPRLNRDRPEDRTTDNELEMRAFDMVLIERCNGMGASISIELQIAKMRYPPTFHRMRTIDTKYLAVPRNPNESHRKQKSGHRSGQASFLPISDRAYDRSKNIFQNEIL